MKKAFFAAVVTASLICMSLIQVVNAQTVQSTQSFKVRMYVYSWNFNEYDAPTIASHFDMSQSSFATGSNDYTQKMNTVKSLNPNYKALVYRNVHTMDISDPDWNLVKVNGWLVKDANGNYVPGGYSSSLYILDVGNPGYQQWVAAKIKSYLDACPYFDGVMIDGGIVPNAIEFRGWGSLIPINPRTNAPFTDADVRNSYLGLYTAIKNAIGSKIMVANGIWDGQDFYDNYNAYVNLLSNSSLNGSTSEGCWYQSGGAWMTEGDWLKSLKMVIWMQNNWLQNHPERFSSTTVGAGPQWTMPSGATREQMMLYGFVSTMLGINYPLQNIMDFAFNGAQSSVPANLMQLEENLSAVDIGEPLAGYYIVQSHVYTRDFTGGKIMVNPTSTPYTVTLPSTFRTLDGQLVNSINIQPHTGVILTSTTPPSGTVFSDDFEGGNLSKWTFAGPDQWNGAGATLALESQIVHTGRYAVRMTTPGIVQNEAAECAKDVNLPEFSLSFYAKIVSWDRRLGSNLYLAWAHGLNGYQSYLCYASLLQSWDGTYRWRLNIRSGQSTDATYLSAPTSLDNNWHYIQLHWKNDVTQGFAELFVDGVNVVATPYVNTATVGNATRLFAGLAVNSGTGGVGSKADVVIDDVVIANP